MGLFAASRFGSLKDGAPDDQYGFEALLDFVKTDHEYPVLSVSSGQWGDGVALLDQTSSEVTCDHVADSYGDLNRHLSTNHPDISSKKHRCESCGESFQAPGELRQHGALCDNRAKSAQNPVEGITNFPCSLCDQRYQTQSDLQHHQWSVHRGNGHVCKLCLQSFKTAGSLKEHFRLCHSRVNCQKCNRGFRNQAGLIRHVCKGPQKTDRRKKKSNKGKQTCSVCGLEVSSYQSLVRHQLRQHPQTFARRHVCTVCGEGFPRILVLRRHQQHCLADGQKPTPRPFKCDTCGQTFLQSVGLRYHHDQNRCKKSENYKRFKCDQCSCRFSKEEWLARHKQTRHGRITMDGVEQQTVFPCSSCSVSFPSKKSLLRHTYVEHLPQKYLCNTCGKGFGANYLLKEHEKLHQYLFVCDLCGTKFCSASGLNRHKQHACEFTENRDRFRCPHCQRTFSSDYYLQGHIHAKHAKQKQYQCDQCGKSFAYARAVKAHKKMTCKFSEGSEERKQKRHECPTCHKLLSTPMSLKQHMKKHQPPEHHCPFCERAFVWKDSMQGHQSRCPRNPDAKRSPRLLKARPQSYVRETELPTVSDLPEASDSSAGVIVLQPVDDGAITEAIQILAGQAIITGQDIITNVDIVSV